MKNLVAILPVLLLSVLVIFLYWPLTKTFYQQDEWLALGNIMSHGNDYLFLNLENPFRILLGEGRLVSRFIVYTLLGLHPFDLGPLVTFAIVFHLVNSILVYYLSSKFFRDWKYSFLSASFFAVNSVAHQAITWPAAAVGTLPATTLILIALLIYFKAIGKHGFEKVGIIKKSLVITVALLIYASLHFKEIGLFLLAFLPMFTLLLRNDLLHSKLKTLLLLVSPFFIFVIYKVVSLKIRTTESNLYITGLQENFFLTIFFRAVLYPLTSFSLLFVPGEPFLSFARLVLRQVYPYFSSSANNILIAQTVILDLLSLILTFLLLVVIYFFLRKIEPEDKKIVLFWVSFTAISFIPYVLLSKDFSYLESRYYYLSIVGAAFLFAWVTSRAVLFLGKITSIVFILILSLYLFFHAVQVSDAIEQQVLLGSWRKSFIQEIKLQVPTLDNKWNVFYITGDQNYWSDGNIVPFQQGTGYTLMILYYNSGKIPRELLRDSYLFDIASQGYKEVGDYGFGYFSTQEELAKAKDYYNFPESSIISLHYDSKEKTLKKTGDN